MEPSHHERSCKGAANEVESPWQESPPVPQAHHDIGHFRNQPREMTYVQGDVPGKDNRTGCCDRPFPAQVFAGVSAILKDRKCFKTRTLVVWHFQKAFNLHRQRSRCQRRQGMTFAPVPRMVSVPERMPSFAAQKAKLRKSEVEIVQDCNGLAVWSADHPVRCPLV